MGDTVLIDAIRASSSAARLVRLTTFTANEPIDCAVSGGADSVALALLAVHAGCEPVRLHHVEHGLRPDSFSETDVVRRLAERLGAGFTAHRVEVSDGPNLEERARVVRYAALPADVATGHTADDLAETLLLHLLRGAGLDGVASMARPRPGGPKRPLLRIRRAETEGLCAEFGLAPVQDAMNDDARFRRVRVRRELLPLMNDIATRDVIALLARHSEIVADDVLLLDELSAAIDPGARWGLVGVASPLARRAVRRWLAAGGVGEGRMVDAATLDRVMAVALGGSSSCDVVDGWRAARTDGRLRIERVGEP